MASETKIVDSNTQIPSNQIPSWLEEKWDEELRMRERSLYINVTIPKPSFNRKN